MILRLFLSLTLLASAPAVALACGNAMLVEGDDAVKQIAQAEKLLERGKLREARQLVEPFAYRFRDGLRQKAELVYAGIVFRSAFDRYDVPHAIRILEGMLEKDKDNPLILSRLAEGYAMQVETSEKAQAILSDLDQRDLMPEAYGYRTLARILAGVGERQAADQAMERCQSMSKRKGVCSFKDAPPEKTHKPAPRSRAAKSKANAS